jgi:hypothetical protein
MLGVDTASLIVMCTNIPDRLEEQDRRRQGAVARPRRYRLRTNLAVAVGGTLPRNGSPSSAGGDSSTIRNYPDDLLKSPKFLVRQESNEAFVGRRKIIHEVSRNTRGPATNGDAQILVVNSGVPEARGKEHCREEDDVICYNLIRLCPLDKASQKARCRRNVVMAE